MMRLMHNAFFATEPAPKTEVNLFTIKTLPLTRVQRETSNAGKIAVHPIKVIAY
jgi:hypothetical protein